MGATYTKISCSLKNIRTLQAVEDDIVEEYEGEDDSEV